MWHVGEPCKLVSHFESPEFLVHCTVMLTALFISGRVTDMGQGQEGGARRATICAEGLPGGAQMGSCVVGFPRRSGPHASPRGVCCPARSTGGGERGGNPSWDRLQGRPHSNSQKGQHLSWGEQGPPWSLCASAAGRLPRLQGSAIRLRLPVSPSPLVVQDEEDTLFQ